MTARESTRIAAPEASQEAATVPEEIDPGHHPTGRAAAEYIAQMVHSLRGLARHEELNFLAYLLGVALEEARQAANSRSAVEKSQESPAGGCG
jgi:hypothetical protein